MFHFLTDPADRRSYVELARKRRPKGVTSSSPPSQTMARIGVATSMFRYNARSLAPELGEGFSLVREARETHTTPWGSPQAFYYGVFRRLQSRSHEFSEVAHEPSSRCRDRCPHPLRGGLGARVFARTGGEKPKGVRVFNVKSVKEPGKGAAELVDIHENSEFMVSRVMRLSPGATIKEHYHPNFDETFFESTRARSSSCSTTRSTKASKRATW